MNLKNLALSLSIFAFSSVNAQNEGNVFFSSPQVHEIYITFNQTSYWDSLTAGYTGDYYIKGDVEIDGVTMLDCGVKMKGNSSYNNPSIKKSFKLDFNEYVSGQDHDGLKKLNLNNCFKDPTFLREKLMLDFVRENNGYGPRCHYANVYLNGTLWGLYTSVEEIDKTFLEANFGDKRGNLFKGDPSGDLKWLGTSQATYETKYELKTNETTNNWGDLINFINTLNNTNVTTLDQSLDTIFDFDNYAITWAAHNLFANLDSYIGSGHNYYLYYDSLTTQFKFITWDVNEAFGNFNQGMSISQLEQMSISYAPNPAGNRPLTEKCLQNTNYFNLYKTTLCDLLQLNFSIYGMEAKIDALANLIRPSVQADPNKFFTNQNFEDNIENDITVIGTPGGNNIPGIKSFIIDRRNALAIQLSSFCTVGLDSEISREELIIYPNPTLNEINFYIQESNLNYEILNLIGSKIQDGILTNGKNTINIESLTEGIYLINVKNKDGNILLTQKISKLKLN